MATNFQYRVEVNGEVIARFYIPTDAEIFAKALSVATSNIPFVTTSNELISSWQNGKNISA